MVILAVIVGGVDLDEVPVDFRDYDLGIWVVDGDHVASIREETVIIDVGRVSGGVKGVELDFCSKEIFVEILIS